MMLVILAPGPQTRARGVPLISLEMERKRDGAGRVGNFEIEMQRSGVEFGEEILNDGVRGGRVRGA